MNFFQKLFNWKRSISSQKIGVVLAGGGAMGAFQIGVFQAIKELQIADSVKIVSGTSIGALNGALFLMEDPKVWLSTWGNASFQSFLSKEEKSSDKTSRRSFADIPKLFSTTLKKLETDWKASEGIEEFILKQNINFFSQDGLENVLDENVNFKKISKSSVDLYACAYNVDLYQPEYFHVNDLSRDDAIKALLASACIPFVYRPVKIGNYHYMDGGVTNPLYKKKNTDNMPIKPLLKSKCDLIIAIFLDQDEQFEESEIPGSIRHKLIELYPEEPLENVKGTGTFDFNQKNIQDSIKQGYRDGLAALAPLAIRLWRGQDIRTAIQKQRDHNLSLRAKNIPNRK